MSKNKNLSIKIDTAFKTWLEDEIIHHFSSIPREDNLSPEEFNKHFRQKNKPVILTNIAKNWPALQKWDFAYFKKHYGSIKIVCNLYSNQMETTLENLIAQILQPRSSIDLPLYLQEWHFQGDCNELKHDFDISAYLSDDWHYKLFNYYNCTLWIGGKGALTNVHQDTGYTSIVHTQLVGQKQWIIFSPQTVLKYDENNELDLKAILKDPNTSPMHAVLKPGDSLYLPFHWWHRVRTIENAISMTINFVNETEVPYYINRMLSMPIAISLNHEFLKNHYPDYHKRCLERIITHAKIMNLNLENILNLPIPPSIK